MRHLVRKSARSLRRASERAATPREAMAAAFARRTGPLRISPLQVETEMAAFLELVRREQPKTILEIGTGVGGTLYLLAWASAPRARILSIDLRLYPHQRRRLYRSFAGGGREIDALEADSHLDETRDRVARFFRGERLDVLFIDGDHGYESVHRDYELYGPLVRNGGLVAFHDIVDGPLEQVGGVPRFWREVRTSLDEPEELVESWEQGGFGIGVGRRRNPES
jgi:predicted O-methyltransferase YrrM